jgi:hypothetical protein
MMFSLWFEQFVTVGLVLFGTVVTFPPLELNCAAA